MNTSINAARNASRTSADPSRLNHGNRRARRRVAAALPLAVAAFALVACGSSDDSGAAGSAGSSSSSSSSTADAADKGATAPSLDSAWVKATEEDMTAIFGTVENPTDSELTLESVDVDVPAKAELHEVVQQAGSAVMQKVDGGVKVPANGRLALDPGGYHIMLVNMKEPITPGQQVTVTLHFSDGSTATAKAAGRAFEGAKENYQAGAGSDDAASGGDGAGSGDKSDMGAAGDMGDMSDMPGMEGMDHSGGAGAHDGH